jgi:probable phosphoglycerate mutase
MTKKIYFVRHGESEGNKGNVHKDEFSPLSEKGREQAVFIANRCAKFSIEVVISSALKRAKETAEIIVSKIGKPLEISNLFIEQRKPTEQIGKPRNDPATLRVEKTIRENFHIKGFRFSDEENFDDLKNRARQALMFLQNRQEENILVVTHNHFMRTLAAYAVFGKKLTGYECEQFFRAFRMETAGITVLKFDEKEEKSLWQLWIWNDHSHL